MAKLLSCWSFKRYILHNMHSELCIHKLLQDLGLPGVNQGSQCWVLPGIGIIHHMVNHIIDRVQHSTITCETNLVVKMKILWDKIQNNSSKRFSIGFSNITRMLLLSLRHLDKVKVRREKNPKTYHSSNFSQCSKEFRSIQVLFLRNRANKSCQTEFRFIMLNKIRHIKRNFHVTSSTLSNLYSQAYHSKGHFIMIKLGKREDKERKNTRNSSGTSNGNGHACIKLFKDLFGFVELGIHLLDSNIFAYFFSNPVTLEWAASQDFVFWLCWHQR